MEICSPEVDGGATEETVPAHPPIPTRTKAKSILNRISKDGQRNLSLLLKSSDSGLLMTPGPLCYLVANAGLLEMRGNPLPRHVGWAEFRIGRNKKTLT